MALRTWTIVAAAAVVIGILETTLFGSDTPGVRHTVSTGFFLLAVAGIVGLVAIAITAAVRRVRARATR